MNDKIIVVGAGPSNTSLDWPAVECATGYTLYLGDTRWLLDFRKQERALRLSLNKRKKQRRARTGRRV